MSGALRSPSRSGVRRIATAAFLALAAARPAGALDPACEAALAAAEFASTEQLAAWNAVEADFGARPTASPAHRGFVRWLRKRLREIPGLTIRADGYPIRRQLERASAFVLELTDGTRLELPTAGALPYVALTDGRGRSAPVVHVPSGQPIAGADVAGRIVIRQLAPVGVPYSVIQAISDYLHDPASTIDPSALYERPYLSGQALEDLEAASAAGAAGLVLVQELPRAQVEGQYLPYPGVFWSMPGVWLGADEGRMLLDAVAAGTAAGATIAVRGRQARLRTQNLIATLPGAGDEKIVVASHTDGMNAIWDNGPIAMLALARHFASVPRECRPRRLEFAFNTAHLYLSAHGAARYADGLVEECERVAFAVVLEHLGSTEFVAVPRNDGPGRTLVATGLPEFTGLFFSPKAALRDAARAATIARDLRRVGMISLALGLNSGEGSTYHDRGIPTLAMIAGPWVLFNPAYGLETVDPDALRRSALAFRDVIVDLQEVPRDVLWEGGTCHPPAE
jgi:hypothetical protein